MANIIITFDDYYNITEYNQFLENLNHNKINYKQLVCVKAPYHFYIEIDEQYAPVFLKYTIAPKGLYKYMLEKVIAYFPNEKFLLKRKISDSPTQFERFISPKIFVDVKTADYAAIFRYKNKEQLITMSRDLGIPIYILGKQREWNLAFSFSKMIKNYVYNDWVLIEKTKKSEYTKPGEFEQEFNYKKLVKVRLTNKYFNYPYYDNGKYFPLKLTH